MQDNRLLVSLPPKSYRELLPGLAAVTLVFGDVLYESGARIRDVSFPGRAVVSLLTVVDGHNALEVGLVGPEGMIGVPLALGVPNSPVRALVQGGGGAMRMRAASFSRALAAITQTAACNRFHVVEARLARWLLKTRDRVASGHFRRTRSHARGAPRRRDAGGRRPAAAGADRVPPREYPDPGRCPLQAAACSCYGSAAWSGAS